MAKFTLFELHIDGVDITAPEFGSASDDDETEAAESGGRVRLVLLGAVVLAVLAVVAVVLKKRLSGSGDSE